MINYIVNKTERLAEMFSLCEYFIRNRVFFSYYSFTDCPVGHFWAPTPLIFKMMPSAKMIKRLWTSLDAFKRRLSVATWKWPIFSVPNLYSFSLFCRMNIAEVCLNIVTFILVSEGTTISNSHRQPSFTIQTVPY